ncbi:hypothetical protein ABBQ32_011546 [Trebouxia sp. C0010 RCD-2024]
MLMTRVKLLTVQLTQCQRQKTAEQEGRSHLVKQISNLMSERDHARQQATAPQEQKQSKMSQKFKRQVQAMCAEAHHKMDAKSAILTSTKTSVRTSNCATAAVTPLPPSPPSPAMLVTLHANCISDHKTAAPAEKQDDVASDMQNKQSVTEAKTAVRPTSRSASTPPRQAAPCNNGTTLDTAARAA